MSDSEVTVYVLEASVTRVEVSDNPNEFIERFLSNESQNTFLILGFGRSYLVNIFSEFLSIDYVYLLESYEFKYSPKIRNLFSNRNELLK